MSTSKRTILDFGFDPEQNEHHFVVHIPRAVKKDITIHELHNYEEDLSIEGLEANFVGPDATGKVILNRGKWDAIRNVVRVEFNQRMRQSGARPNTWKQGINHLHRLFGKELMVLAWAIEDAEPTTIPQAVENWLGLKPEERWWLYTMTNAATGHALRGRNRGWRKALRFALTENPVPEGRYTQSLLDDEAKLQFVAEEQELYGRSPE